MKSWSKSHRFIFLQYESPYKKQIKKTNLLQRIEFYFHLLYMEIGKNILSTRAFFRWK